MTVASDTCKDIKVPFLPLSPTDTFGGIEGGGGRGGGGGGGGGGGVGVIGGSNCLAGRHPYNETFNKFRASLKSNVLHSKSYKVVSEKYTYVCVPSIDSQRVDAATKYFCNWKRLVRDSSYKESSRYHQCSRKNGGCRSFPINSQGHSTERYRVVTLNFPFHLAISCSYSISSIVLTQYQPCYANTVSAMLCSHSISHVMLTQYQPCYAHTVSAMLCSHSISYIMLTQYQPCYAHTVSAISCSYSISSIVLTQYQPCYANTVLCSHSISHVMLTQYQLYYAHTVSAMLC